MVVFIGMSPTVADVVQCLARLSLQAKIVRNRRPFADGVRVGTKLLMKDQDN